MRSGNLQRAVLGSGRRLASNAIRPLTRLRYASTEHGREHHDHHAEDATEYPKEGFATSTVFKVVAFAGAIAAFYKYAPSASDDNIITRYISNNFTSSEVWEKSNLKHTVLEQQQADNNQLLWSAQKPPVHRFRYPQQIDQALPHRQPVGSRVDLSDLVVKQG
ncbi:hypothetical protein BDM02DRAFT_3099618 [Thelephora ganbajun]|uniref:Uncharacterized protein n=1 Tax=Thelephora ganbajun TaxID=370292 RepID=A0ACB6ZB22_THEGA|nr:hypothetical protein BDM02DRAFT_3099618 [Thelephora ganbajun]